MKAVRPIRGGQRKRDDRGSAIVIVIIAMAMIGILATTLLWMAYMNYMIKIADVRNKNSFYSAEEVVEQIMAGLQHTSADAVGVAYRDVMANWESLGTQDNRYSAFAAAYMDTVLESLQDDSLGRDYYDRDKLKAYVDADIFLESSPDEGVDVTAWERGGAGAGETPRRPQMERVNNNSILLHNIYVSYTDSENRVSVIQTDICLDVPKLIFENGGSIDGLYEYTLIGNKGIEVAGGGGTATAEGSIFAGTDAGDKGGLVVKQANTLTLHNARRVVSQGDILVEGPAAGLVVQDMPGEDNRVYARNITLNSGMVSLDSKTYVANDLSLNGSGSQATLTKEYYGYGVSTYNGLPGEPVADGRPKIEAASSSAIIINGKNSAVDMAGVNRLLLAGRSYIGQATTQAEAESYRAQMEAGIRQPGAPVMMGESIAVKGGQIAYLVPAECIGTLDGETVIGQNPINGNKENDIQDMLQENQGGSGETDNPDSAENAGAAEGVGNTRTFHEVDFNKKVYRLGGRSLSEFGVTDMDHIRKVYAPYKNGTLLYYYLVMDKNQAQRYFEQYYNFNANKEAIDRYFHTYAAGGILLGDFAAPDNQYTILGNSLVSSAITDSGVTLLTSIQQNPSNPDDGENGTPEEDGDGSDHPPADPDFYTEIGDNAQEVVNRTDEAAVLSLSKEIADTYRALTYNLTEDASLVPTDPDLVKEYDVFNSIIKEKEVEKYLKDNLYGDTVIYETDSGLQAVLTRKSAVTVSGFGEKTRLIISYGDVTVDRNFTGLIIAKGKITIDPSKAALIKQDKMDLFKVLEAKHKDENDDTITPIDMFVNGDGSMLNGAQAPEVDAAGNLVIDYGEIVQYRNWIKK